jgi:hypothetical protein
VSNVDDLEKFKPQRSQIKNANAYLERGRYIIGAYRKKFWAEQFLHEIEYENMEDFIEIFVLKQNNGALNKIEAIFDAPVFTIVPIENTLTTADDAAALAADS